MKLQDLTLKQIGVLCANQSSCLNKNSYCPLYNAIYERCCLDNLTPYILNQELLDIEIDDNLLMEKNKIIKNYILGNRDDTHSVFTLPEGHVIYVVGMVKNDHWEYHEEHVNMTEVQMTTNYSKVIIHTKEGNKYVLEVDAFTTVQGAMEVCEERWRLMYSSFDTQTIKENSKK